MNLDLCKKIILKYIPLKVVDKFFYYQLLLIAPFLKLYTKYTGASLPKSRELLKKVGVYPIMDHYYQPLFNDARLKKSLREPRHLPGINLNHNEQIVLMKKLIHNNELKDLKLNKLPETIYDFDIRGAFKFGDAEFLYQIIRLLKPKKFVEIGSGSSTKIAYQALKKNKEETNIKLLVGHIACPLPPKSFLKPFDLILTSFPHFVEILNNQGIKSEYFKIGFDKRILS